MLVKRYAKPDEPSEKNNQPKPDEVFSISFFFIVVCVCLKETHTLSTLPDYATGGFASFPVELAKGFSVCILLLFLFRLKREEEEEGSIFIGVECLMHLSCFYARHTQNCGKKMKRLRARDHLRSTLTHKRFLAE